jgi:succinyl-CoA synthetase alpha subunit
VAEAVKATGADTSVIFVPANFAADAILEASYGGIKLVIAISEGVPVQDMIKVTPILKKNGTKLIGPNCPGLITPEESLIGILPGMIFKKDNIGLISRSGPLTYEVKTQHNPGRRHGTDNSVWELVEGHRLPDCITSIMSRNV